MKLFQFLFIKFLTFPAGDSAPIWLIDNTVIFQNASSILQFNPETGVLATILNFNKENQYQSFDIYPTVSSLNSNHHHTLSSLFNADPTRLCNVDPNGLLYLLENNNPISIEPQSIKDLKETVSLLYIELNLYLPNVLSSLSLEYLKSLENNYCLLSTFKVPNTLPENLQQKMINLHCELQSKTLDEKLQPVEVQKVKNELSALESLANILIVNPTHLPKNLIEEVIKAHPGLYEVGILNTVKTLFNIYQTPLQSLFNEIKNDNRAAQRIENIETLFDFRI